ncbi:Zinc finger BED domain-containing protein 1 [Merluccius polli]|uniref:Zinc finger BED domain-containing protein 1 n=1 Tax=Merluccius polli TaxID=89951 RepID=A0AA47MK95_MERPO|nr:Zinc finger BED domain-containing protein 1 [Merluccius polli]
MEENVTEQGNSGTNSQQQDEQQDEQPTQTEELVHKRGGTSVAWMWFGFKKTDTDQTTVVCKVCRCTVPTTDSNTTNLFYHLRKNHDKEYRESQREKAAKALSSNVDVEKKKLQTQTLQQAFTRGTPYSHTSRRWKEITTAVAKHICKDMAPIYTVEKRGFCELVQTLDPRYEMPSRKHLNKVVLPALYDECRAKVEEEIHKGMFYATTTDMWSSRTTHPYMSLTIHFIDQAWNLRSRCLQTSYFPEDHTGQEIARGLSEALESWGLNQDHLVCVTTDNASNNILALELMNETTRLQCFGHRLHLAIGRGVKVHQVERAVGVCKKIVAAFSNSWKRRRELAKAQAEQNPPLPRHQLITETPTRWGSMQAMVERVIEQEKALSQVLRADKKTRHLVPTWQDMDVLESMNKALSPLKEFTDALSGELYPSVSYLKPVLHLFNNQILKHQDGDTELTTTIKEGILKYLNEKYDDKKTQELLDMASLVDPRFKTTYIKQERVDYIKTRAAAQLQKLVAEQAEPEAAPLPSAATARDQDEPEEVPAKKKKKSLSSYFKTAAKPSQAAPHSSRESIENELNLYLLLDAGPDTDPLEWWKKNEGHFPHVAKLARKYLCIPATSSPSERAFSASGNIVSCQRSALKPARVDQLVFLALNL